MWKVSFDVEINFENPNRRAAGWIGVGLCSTSIAYVHYRSTYRSSPKRDSSPVPAVEPSGSPKVEKEKLATADEVVKKIEVAPYSVILLTYSYLFNV